MEKISSNDGQICNMNNLTIEIIALAVMSISLSVLAFLFYTEYVHLQHIKRIKLMISENEEERLELLKEKSQAGTVRILEKIQAVMTLAGIKLAIPVFLLLIGILIALFAFGFSLFLKHWIGYLIGSLFGAFIASLIIQAMILARKKEFNRAFAIAISVLVKMMKTGVGFEQAMYKSIQVSNSKLLKETFQGFFKEKNTIGEEEAFAHMNRLVASKELRIFALAVKIGRASGGRFSNTLEKVEQTLVYRKQMQDKVDVVTQEGAVGSYIVAGIAVFLYFALNGNFDGKLHEYYMTSEYGRFQLLGIFLWVFLGLMVNKKITRIKQ